MSPVKNCKSNRGAKRANSSHWYCEKIYRYRYRSQGYGDYIPKRQRHSDDSYMPKPWAGGSGWQDSQPACLPAPADGINIVDICQTYFNHFLTPFDTVSTCMGRLIKWTFPSAYRMSFSRLRAQKKMPMTNAERKQNQQKQTAHRTQGTAQKNCVQPRKLTLLWPGV